LSSLHIAEHRRRVVPELPLSDDSAHAQHCSICSVS
jgi:hypothetical protein